MIIFKSPGEFRKHRNDLRHWKTALLLALEQQKFDPNVKLKTLPNGENPVFQLAYPDQNYVVKFFSPWYGGKKVFKRERRTLTLAHEGNKLKLDTWEIPRYVTSGKLYKKETLEKAFPSRLDVWDWPYLILTYVSGIPLLDIFHESSREDKLSCARSIGENIKKIHEIPVEESRRDFSSFERWMVRQRRMAVKRHVKWNDLNESTLSELPKYLPSNVKRIWKGQEPKQLHGDVSDENLLGKKDSNGKLVSCGIIDFGDSRIGDPLYDFVALHLSLFRCDLGLLRAFMDGYGYKIGDLNVFSFKAMCYTLLHKEDAMRTVFNYHPEWKSIVSLKELALKIWVGDESFGNVKKDD